MANEEDEEPLEAEILRVRMIPRNPTNREKRKHEDSGHLVYRSWSAACVEGRGVVELHRSELLEEEERNNNSDCSCRLRFLVTGSNSDLSRQQVWSNGSDVLCTQKVPHHTPFHFTVGFVKDLGFCNIILKCDNEPSTKALVDAVMHACVGVEVIPPWTT